MYFQITKTGAISFPLKTQACIFHTILIYHPELFKICFGREILKKHVSSDPCNSSALVIEKSISNIKTFIKLLFLKTEPYQSQSMVQIITQHIAQLSINSIGEVTQKEICKCLYVQTHGDITMGRQQQSFKTWVIQNIGWSVLGLKYVLSVYIFQTHKGRVGDIRKMKG